MKLVDIIVFVSLTIFISVLGVLKAKWTKEKKDEGGEKANGPSVSTLSVSLAVCSSFISAISLLGYPAEIYYRGALLYWYCLMYLISFPIIAFVFMPTFYELKLPSLYEYLERRFAFACRLLTSTIFLCQTALYSALVLYAPALALSSAFNVSIFLAIVITSLLSAVYLCVGGARAGIYTSALQMALIFVSYLVIVIVSYYQWGFTNIYTSAKNGLRLDILDFRVDPRIRHSVFSLVIGGSFGMFTLYASNQLTMQRFIMMPTLKLAQKVLLINIPMNIFMINMYTIIGTVLYFAFQGCHPALPANDQLLPHFLVTKLSWVFGLEGIYFAALYSAGLSTLTAIYNALTDVFVEDIIKVSLQKLKKQTLLTEKINGYLRTYLPLFFALLAVSISIYIRKWEAMILQIGFSIFGTIGGVIFGAFCVGLLCPWINSSIAAFLGEFTALILSVLMVVGTFVYEVKPINLPLDTSCSTNITEAYKWDSRYNSVTASDNSFFSNYWQISYQYYPLVGVIVNFFVAHIVQLLVNIFCKNRNPKVNPKYLLHLIRPYFEESQEELVKLPQEIPLLEKRVKNI